MCYLSDPESFCLPDVIAGEFMNDFLGIRSKDINFAVKHSTMEVSELSKIIKTVYHYIHKYYYLYIYIVLIMPKALELFILKACSILNIL